MGEHKTYYLKRTVVYPINKNLVCAIIMLDDDGKAFRIRIVLSIRVSSCFGNLPCSNLGTVHVNAVAEGVVGQAPS